LRIKKFLDSLRSLEEYIILLMAKKFYITTTLPYVNADPHIGFAMELIQADAIARYHRFLGDEVIFNTGTDEHGQKVAQAAEQVMLPPSL